MSHQITRATIADEAVIREILAEAGLPHLDFPRHLAHFLVAKSNGTLLGVIGLEIYGADGLLRSWAVRKAERGRGIGRELYQSMLAHAQLSGVRQLFLLTTTAESFFAKCGWEKAPRTSVPAAMAKAEEFTSLCPSRAVCMRRRVDSVAQYFPRQALELRPDVPGAAMWAVVLEKTMLTYFEVEPGCRFPAHQHESEQITMVLEGVLYFETSDGVYGVKAGEVIAVPSSVPHAVFTQNERVKAIDAWSPVMEKYRKPAQTGNAGALCNL